jgi:hypothetical protein
MTTAWVRSGPELAEHAGHMGPNGLDADGEPLCDGGVAESLGDEPEHFPLPDGERLTRTAFRHNGSEGHVSYGRRIEQAVPGGHGPHGGDQLVGARALQHEPRGPGSQRPKT